MFVLGMPITNTEALVRAVVMYFAGLVAIRIGKHRLLGRTSALDIILGFILGSLLSRGINGSASMSSSIVATFTLVFLHMLLSKLAYHADWFGWLIKGASTQIYGDGKFIKENMCRAAVSHRDIEMDLRLNGNVDSAKGADALYLERNGEISVVKTEVKPRLLEVRVEAGVQIVRIQLE